MVDNGYSQGMVTVRLDRGNESQKEVWRANIMANEHFNMCDSRCSSCKGSSFIKYDG